MDDLISRKQAIEACYNGWNKDYKEIAKDIKDLPPAQPKRCDSSNILRYPECENRTKLGNCNPVGGFCTSVPKEMCDAQEHEKENITDTISRQAVIDTVHKIIYGFFYDEDGAVNNTEKSLFSVNKAICNGVRELPPAPQRTGRWMLIEEGLKVAKYRCSECGRCIFDDRGYDPCVDYPYCHCGARMED